MIGKTTRYTIVFLFLSLFSLAPCYAQVSMTVNKSTGFLEIRNGLLGIVIPRENSSKTNQFPAPIQSFIYSDGTYSDNTVNYLKASTIPSSFAVKILTQTSNEITVRVEYRFTKKKASDPGFYTCSITVRKGEKTILIEEDSENDIYYSVKISNGLSPDKARYRGWESYAKEAGYEPNGEVYRAENKRGYPLDATIDLQYQKTVSYQRLTLWEPAGGEVNTGRYWQVFNSGQNNTANLFGFFQGKPNRLIGAKHVGPGLKTSPDDPVNKERNAAEIQLAIDRAGPDNTWFSRKRFQWAVFISTKNDLLSPEKNQPIGYELNRVSGLGSVIRQYLNKPVTLVPSFYKGAIYMSAENIAAICDRVRKDERFYESLYKAEPAYKGYFDAWRFKKTNTEVLEYMSIFGDVLVKQYTEGEGTYDFNNRYWMGARNFKYYALAIAYLFADRDNRITEEQRKKLTQVIGLMARIVWDDNNVPLFDSSGVNQGPANMALQYRNNARTFFALLLANDPEFKERARKAAADIDNDINNTIYENGAGIGTPHYSQPAIEPVLFSILQLKQAGVVDLFKTNKRLKKFARFYASLATPPSVRFSGNRKLISFGDGSEESSAMFALLATGFQDSDPALSEQLLSLYFHGPARYSQAGSVILASDFSAIPQKRFDATSCNYTGYMSHFRAGVNTSDESALWVLNGDRLYDHRMDDAGEIAIYALQAPLTVAWSCFYYPHATDARIKSVVVPEPQFPQWKTANQPIGERSLTNRTWPVSALQQFTKMRYSASATIRMQKNNEEWYRTVSMLYAWPDAPMIIFYDSLKGNTPFIWSMPMMSEGAVGTDAGLVQPIRKIHNNADRQELPEATAVKNLSAGLHQFSFTGQSWPAHASGGINWHLYSLNEAPAQFTLSHWANTWQNQEEQNEFLKTNGRSYTEEQQIIRIRGSRPFFSVLLPYRKGTDPYKDKVKQVSNNELAISIRGDHVLISPAYYYVKKQNGMVLLGLFSKTASVRKEGWNISGGCTEIEYMANTIKIRVHGNSGKRNILVPFRVTPVKKYDGLSSTVSGAGQLLTIPYTKSGDDLENGAQGYTEYIFEKK